MTVIFTGANYTGLDNDPVLDFPGGFNFINGNETVLNGDLMLFWVFMPTDDITIESEPAVLTPLGSFDDGAVRMYWKWADAEDEDNSARERYEWIINPVNDEGLDWTYRKLPVLTCSWSGVFPLNPVGTIVTDTNSDIAPANPDARTNDNLVTFHIAQYTETTFSSLPGTPTGMTLRGHASGYYHVASDWATNPLDVKNFRLTVFDMTVTETGPTEPKDAPHPNAIVHGVSGAILLAGSPPEGASLSGRPPGDRFPWIVTAGSVVTNPVPPSISVIPAISGVIVVGNTISVSHGSWIGYPPPAITVQWERNNLAISGATGFFYTLAPEDEGQSIKAVVTATNASGSATTDSNMVVPTATPTGDTGPPSDPTPDPTAPSTATLPLFMNRTDA